MEQARSRVELLAVLFIIITFTDVLASAIPAGEKKTRVHDQPLSNEQHEVRGQHNSDYDHDAFLGHEEAESFEQLTPEEGKARLAIIVDKIDKNGDGFVEPAELESWIKEIQHLYIKKDTERMWRDHQPDTDNTLSWESYQKRTFGYSDEPVEGSPTFEYKNMIERDRRRWQQADHNKDGKLSKDEFMSFLHPEEVEHMRDIVVDETVEDIDKDGDGYISLQEYIGDMWHREGQEQESEEPDWVKSEREQFVNFRDKNKDGLMDKEEVKEWIIPHDYDHSQAEAKHLIFESDADKDGKLTKEEILDKYDLFVGSQATDFGEALTKHDEF